MRDTDAGFGDAGAEEGRCAPLNGTYLDRFVFPIRREDVLIDEQMTFNGGLFGYVDNTYPCGLLAEKRLSEINFAPVTILYGGNGSGKSTVLNLIAAKLGLARCSPFSSGEMFDRYTDACVAELGISATGARFERIPVGSSVIASDDVFDYMLSLRTANDEVAERKGDAVTAWRELRYGETIRTDGSDGYELFRMQYQARRRTQSRRTFIRRTAGSEAKLQSNGETALGFFEERLSPRRLHCLDEPENSLSPKLQLELVEVLDEAVRCCSCQLVIATHSPFLLAYEGARIYDLDGVPVDIKQWTELESIRIYRRFFKDREDRFERG